jgi:hypothetical protein
MQVEVVEAGRPAKGVICWWLVELHEEVNACVLGHVI